MGVYFTDSTGARIEQGAGFTANGDYVLDKSNLNLNQSFIFGAKGVGAGSTAGVLLWYEVGGKRLNLESDTPKTATTAAPVAWPNKYLPRGKIGVTISSLTGTVAVEVSQ